MPFMDECALMALEVPRDRCPATDALEFLDDHPEYRLPLEDTWTGPSGRVYRQAPADVISRWPAHLARTFRSFLKIGKDPDQVFQLLDLLQESSGTLRSLSFNAGRAEAFARLMDQ